MGITPVSSIPLLVCSVIYISWFQLRDKTFKWDLISYHIFHHVLGKNYNKLHYLFIFSSLVMCTLKPLKIMFRNHIYVKVIRQRNCKWLRCSSSLCCRQHKLYCNTNFCWTWVILVRLDRIINLKHYYIKVLIILLKLHMFMFIQIVKLSHVVHIPWSWFIWYWSSVCL